MEHQSRMGLLFMLYMKGRFPQTLTVQHYSPTFHLVYFQLFSVIVFGCISSQQSGEHCMYNDDPNACGFGVAVGVIAFLGCMAFLVLDALFENISSIQQRKHVVLGDIGFSGKLQCFSSIFLGHDCFYLPASESLWA